MELKSGGRIYWSKQAVIIHCDKCYDRGNTGVMWAQRKGLKHSFGKLINVIYNIEYLHWNLTYKEERDDSIKNTFNWNTLMYTTKMPSRKTTLFKLLYRMCKTIYPQHQLY